MSGLEPALLGLVAVLQGDEHALQRPQQAEADDERQRQEDDEMHPDRRLVGDLGPQREAEHDEAARSG